MYESTVTRVIAPAADSDSFTLSIDPGQTITVVVNSAATLQPKVELFRVKGKSLDRFGRASADAAGQDAVIQTIRTPGTLAGQRPDPQTYQVTVSGVSGTTGRYDLQVILNAAVEEENHDGRLNDTRAKAQDLTDAFLSLNSASANGSGPERAAVLGQIRPGTSTGDVSVDGPAPPAALQPDPGDFYSLSLKAAQSMTLALESLAGGQVSFELQDASGKVLAKSVPGATNVDQVINDFVAPKKGTYLVRVSGDPRAEYSLVATRDAGFDTAQDILSRAAAGRQWVLGSVGTDDNSGGPRDVYRVTLAERKTLELETTLPAAGSGEFVNNLDPMLRVYDPAGKLVASNDNFPPDNRNAKLKYKTPRGQGGTYTVEVLPSDLTAQPTQGEYILSIKGSTGSLPPFQVVATDPANGSRARGPTTQITVDFNDTLLLTSLQASDLTVNGVPAVSLNVLDGDTAIFDLPTLGEGSQHVRITGGAVKDVQGTSLEAFEMSFSEDYTPPRVVYSSIQPGDVLPAGELTYVVRFSEPMQTDTSGWWDVPLLDTDTLVPYYPGGFQFDETGTVLTVHYSSPPEGNYRLTLISDRFQDQAQPRGLHLDGEPDQFPIPPAVSGDGFEGGDFTVEFAVDVDTIPFPTPLISKAPLGSLVYDSAHAGLVQPAGDTDSVIISLDAHQMITVIVTPAAELQPTIELVYSSSTILGTATAAGTGQQVVLQTIPVASAGTYTVRVGGFGGTTGDYQVRVVLNAAVEEEDHGGPSNDMQPVTAES